MRWLNRFHDEHEAVQFVLMKLEGNLKDIEHGESDVNVIWELKEFAEIINNVIIPHFKAEEKDIYPEALRLGIDEKFIAEMYDEHNVLYEAFKGFNDSIGKENLGIKLKEGGELARIISKSRNIDKIEVPKNLDEVPEKPAQLNIDKAGIIANGYKIIQLLGNHIQKEETRLPELLGTKHPGR
jgi:hemerythrin-like domain-containing protein